MSKGNCPRPHLVRLCYKYSRLGEKLIFSKRIFLLQLCMQACTLKIHCTSHNKIQKTLRMWNASFRRAVFQQTAIVPLSLNVQYPEGIEMSIQFQSKIEKRQQYLHRRPHKKIEKSPHRKTHIFGTWDKSELQNLT